MLSRSFACFFLLLALAGVIARLAGASFDPTILWVDLRALPMWMGTLLLLALMTSLGLHLARRAARWAAAVPGVFVVVSLVSTVQFYRLLYLGEVRSGAGVPFTVFVLMGMAWVAVTMLRRRDNQADAVPGHARGYIRRAVGTSIGVLTLVVLFALGQMWCFGKTDYTRSADAIVVFGARTYADGRLSSALEDRVRTGVALYRDGHAPRLIMSGGPGDGAIDEPTAMRDFAVSLGVPADAIDLDPTGLNTRGTIQTLSALPSHPRLLAVSHFYHLPRVKLAAHQAGVDVFTVPARETFVLRQLPRYMAREVAAFWVYLVRDA